jgi:hypothetical protein
MKALRKLFDVMQLEDCVPVFDDFIKGPDTTNTYAATLTNSGTATLVNTGGNSGVLALAASGVSPAASDQSYFATTNSFFLPLSGQPLLVDALIQFTELNTNQANIFFGIASGVAANLQVAANGGMRTTGTILGFSKVGGSTVWTGYARNGSTVQSTVSVQASGLATWQRLSVEIIDQVSLLCTVVFKVDGQILTDVNGNFIKFIVPYSGLTKCQLVIGIRNGTVVTGGGEVVNVDWWYGQQRRNLANIPTGP